MNWSRKLNRLDAELKEFHRFNELAADVIWTLEDSSRLTGRVPMRNDGFGRRAAIQNLAKNASFSRASKNTSLDAATIPVQK